MFKNNNNDNNKGCVGLVNLGNTCFLNSCIQVLSNTHELNKILDNNGRRNNIDDSILLDGWNDIRKKMTESVDGSILSPNKFVNSIQRLAEKKNLEMFTGWNQNDISEFLIFLVNSIHNSISRSVIFNITGKKENNKDERALKCYRELKIIYEKEYSEIMDLFYGLSTTEILSKDESINHTIRPEQFFVLDLPIPKMNSITIYDCFDLFTRKELLTGENAWYNEKKKIKEDVIRKTCFWDFPKILILTFCRFTENGNKKRNDKIKFPIDRLDLSNYVNGYSPNQYVYELYAVCNHMGSVSGGHYNAYIKKDVGKWLFYDDENIREVDIESNINSKEAYCLFYRKKNTVL